MRPICVLALVTGLLSTAAGHSAEYNGALATHRQPLVADQIIVQWRTDAAMTGHAKLAAIARTAGVSLVSKGALARRTAVLKLGRPVERAELDRLIAHLNSDPDVDYAAVDERRYAHATPADPLIVEQWYFLSGQPAATRAERAWDITTGSTATIVAVLDTGVRFEHPDLGRVELGGKLLPGFDFISNAPIANDGDGRDADPSDPGDWVSAADVQQPPFNSGNCIQPGRTHEDSSWHGTRVASLIGALTSNAEGMAGSGWSTLLLPARVLGKCGGHDSDIIAAMRWSAGLEVPGVPANPTPAKIINLSLGANGPCSPPYQAAVAEITNRDVLIVASVGNDGGPVGSPANCAGVLGVTGLRHAGTKVGFSNLGAEAAIGAPGGNCVNTSPGAPCLFSIVVATNTGLTSPDLSTYTNQFNFNVGTSFSAPLAAGAAALMHAVNGRLAPANFISLLRETAAPFATSSATTTNVCRPPVSGDVQNQECICTTQTCGAGMLNTHAAVLAAQRPFAIATAPTLIDPGVQVSLDASASFASNGRSISAYQWSLANVTGAAPAIADQTQAQTTLQAAGPAQFTLRLTVTDDQSAQDTAEIRMTTATFSPTPTPPPAPAPTPPPTPAASGGGGGVVLEMLAALLILGLARCAIAAESAATPGLAGSRGIFRPDFRV